MIVAKLLLQRKQMVTFSEEIKRCENCQQKSQQTILNSYTTFGSPDLDLRPPSMERETIWMWIQHCPHCGYCSTHIQRPNEFKNDEQKKFDTACWQSLRGAWVCDDSINDDAARKCRLRTLELIDKCLEDGKTLGEQVAITECIQVDILRRIGEFDRALTIISTVLSIALILLQKPEPEEVIVKMLKFQRRLIEANDKRDYTISDAQKMEND
ncbi:unnamed protein product [Didymodactylos carnosus]|uniref:Uncharacterized protein n=1 Tax=Didymodactylos carnosus TaxID=1234261 RepID=A0A8S2IIK8_9BILA|nr:unnamed protein product [Didymodactylos carnosus]CAF3733181.1 unnamed protein product [Didymodactylos carnosus]